MVITIRRLDDICVVTLTGSIDALTAERITDSLNEQIGAGEKILCSTSQAWIS